MAGPLQEQVLGINFTRGLETLEDERIVQPGKLLTLTNAVLDENRTITPRPGWSNAVTGLTSLNGLATFNNELLAMNGQTLYSVGANSVAYSRGTAPNCLSLTKDSVYRSNRSQDQFDCAVADPSGSNSTYACFVWRESTASGTVTGLYVTVRDEVSGAVLLPPTQMIATTTAECPRVVAQGSGTAFFIFYGDSPNLYCRVIETSALATLGAETTLRTDYVSGGFDACAFSGDGPSHALVVYYTSHATDSIYAIGANRSGTTPSVGNGPTAITTKAQVTIVSGMTCAEFATFSAAGIYLISSVSGMWGAVLSNAYVVTGAAAVLDGASIPGAGHSTITAAYDATALKMNVYYDHLADWGGNGVIQPIRKSVVNTSNAVTTGPTSWTNSATYQDGTNGGAPNGPFIAGKAFSVSSTGSAATTTYLPVFIGGLNKLQNTWLLLDGSGNAVARALTGSYGFRKGATFATAPPFVSVPSSAANAPSIICPVGETAFLVESSNGFNISPVGLSRVALTFSGGGGGFRAVPHLDTQLGQNTFVSGGALTAYDGVNATEAGFHEYPEGIKVATGAAGSIGAGTYQYCALYEWIDGAGQRHQSAPSPAVSYTAPGAARATVTIPTLQLTTKENVNIAIFRTQDAGAVFYRLNPMTSPVTNSKAAAMVTYSDNTTDANLVSGEILYTDGGALPATAPPTANALCVHQNRVVAAPTENPNEFRYSQPAVTNYGVQWSDVLGGTVDTSGGGLVAPASIDDKLILFATRKIFCIFGNGPNATGLQNGYSTPQEIPSDVGCSEARSILSTPAGIIFKSAKGWYLLNRALQVQYIGSGVEAQNGNSVCAAVLHPTEKRAIFYSSGGTALVYDYLGEQWSIFTNYSVTDAAWWPGRALVAQSTSGGAVTIDAGAATDNGTAITASISTSWLHLGEALHGFQRVWEVMLGGKYTASTTLTVQAFYDNGTTAQTTGAITTSTIANASSTAWDLRWKPPIQKCSRIRIAITNAASTAGIGFSSLSMRVGLKKGGAKLAAAQSI